ncbi:MAG: sulfotransferase family protein [Acidimicrobiia bacterium]
MTLPEGRHPADPVVIGGVGGSGTRVVAKLLREAGVYLGADLNPALDNLWFTILFKRPWWYRRAVRSGGADILRMLAVFQKLMSGLPLTVSERGRVTGAALQVAVVGHSRRGGGRGAWALRRLSSMLRAGRAPQAAGWGFKEPNTHVYLDQLARHFPTMRYVHVIRNGLEIATSGNQGQFLTWRSTFGLSLPKDHRDLPGAALEFWAKANRRALALGSERLGDRFLLVRYEGLSREPEKEVRRLLEFAQPAGGADAGRLAALVRPSGRSGGRHHPAWLSEDHRAWLSELGY